MSQDIVIVDICGTLFNSNTTFDFLDFSISDKKYIRFRKISKRFIWRLINYFMFHVLGFDLTRIIAIRFLKGKTENELDLLMSDFFLRKLTYLKYADVWKYVDVIKSEGYRMILASATLDFIAKRVSIETGILEYFPTKLNYHQTICQGTIIQDLLGRKFAFLKSKKIEHPFAIIITDNFSDIDVIRNSKLSVIVSKEKDLLKWKNLLNKNNIVKFDFIIVK